MAKESSFDIVSTVDMQEIDNAFQQAKKELAQRYDLKDSGAEITLDKAGAHRSDVAQVYGKGFASQLFRSDPIAQEMNILHEQIGRYDHRFRRIERQNRTVVTDSFTSMRGN